MLRTSGIENQHYYRISITGMLKTPLDRKMTISSDPMGNYHLISMSVILRTFLFSLFTLVLTPFGLKFSQKRFHN